MDVEKDYCRFCEGETYQKKVIRPIGPHYGEMICVSCNNRIKFLPKPRNENKRKQNKYSAEAIGINYCEMCLRDREQLFSYETLEVHHKIQISMGGEDKPGNIWVVCTPCHRLIHFCRTYLRRTDNDFGLAVREDK